MNNNINIINNLSNDEIMFLNENILLKEHFYNLLLNVKNNNETKIIICYNSYERRFVHILANSLGLYHSKYGDWSELFKQHQETNSQDHYKIIGVKVSTNPI